MSNPPGIDCGTQCQYRFYENTNVVLTAIPDIGYQSGLWGGNCSICELSENCAINMDASKSCSISFISVVQSTGESGNKEIDPFLLIKPPKLKPLCFIATAAYGSYLASEVETLREFRDQYLMRSEVGREIVKVYYQYSPDIAEVIAGDELLRAAVRILLTPIVYSIRYPIMSMGMMLIVIVGLIWIRKTRKWR